MEIIAIIACNTAIISCTLLLGYVIICAIVYLYEEIHHELKKLKTTLRKAWWDLEWKLTH